MKKKGQTKLYFLIGVLIALLVAFCYGTPEESASQPRTALAESAEPADILKEDLSIDLEPSGDRDSPAAPGKSELQEVEGSGEEGLPGDGAAELQESDQGENGPVVAQGKSERKAVPDREPQPAQSLKKQPVKGPELKPAPDPEPQPDPAPPASQPPQTPKPEAPAPSGPVTYVWRGAHQVSFRSEVHLTNTGSERAQNVWVDIPMLENSSPYQETRLQSTNYELAYMTGRVGSFGVGDIGPGETVVITMDYAITIRPLSIKSSNETVEKARQAYQQFAGSGNCLQLASGFVGRCREMGLNARLVNGFARSHGNIAPGSLEGWRHSWAEFHIDGLGWVPVDLTFKYFADFPTASHVVETYADQSVKAYHLGGKLSINWRNMIL